MSPAPAREEMESVLRAASEAARGYLASLDDRPARSDPGKTWFGGDLPDQGVGAERAVRELADHAPGEAVASAGPKCFHFVIGGTTPAALGADWLTSTLDQIAYAWVSSPLATELETLSLGWLRDLFDLPDDFIGVMTTGATMANFVGLAAAREWWADQRGVDASEEGLAGLARPTALASGHVHASAIKALSMLGLGRRSLRRLTQDEVGTLDLDALRDALESLEEGPAIIIATAGEPNAGAFDPIDEISNLARAHGAWLHVDGAFGLFARVSPRVERLARGAERADSIAVDGHKWLNAPYDCGFAFVRHPAPLGRAFDYRGEYLPAPEDPRPNFGAIGPESSRRARALAVWATLRAYGREGVRAMVEKHLDLAAHLAQRVDEEPDLERLSDTTLNVVCFRLNPGGLTGDELNDLNRRLAEAVLEDGRVWVGATTYAGKTALRPAISNWRTEQEHIDLLVDVVRELGARLRA